MKSRIHLKILEKRTEAPDTVSLVLQPMDGELLYKAGQFLTLLLMLNGKEARRSYSFSSSPDTDPYPVITIKRKVNGLASTYLVEKTRPGETLTAFPPAGQFTLPASQAQGHQLVMVAGGSGITPIFSLLKQALAHTTNFQVLLIYASRNRKSLVFSEDLKKWLHSYPGRFRSILLLSTPDTGVDALRDEPFQVIPRRLGNTLLEELIQKNVPAGRAPVDFFLCGPPGLLLKSEMALRFMEFPEGRIHKEIFTISRPFRPPAELFPAGMVTLSVSEEEFSFPLEAGQTILEAAENAGLELPYSCRSGICTSCTAKCRSGEVMMYLPGGPLSSTTTRGVIQTCVGYPLTQHTRVTLE